MNQVAVVMGSQSDWKTMSCACEMLNQFDISHLVEIISAHRTPDKLQDFAKNAREYGIKIIIAGAGGAAHLPGMIAAHTTLPVLGVPVQSKALNGIDSLLSIVQMPRGVAVGTLAIGNSGAANAGILAAQILAVNDKDIASKIDEFRSQQTAKVLSNSNPRKA